MRLGRCGGNSLRFFFSPPASRAIASVLAQLRLNPLALLGQGVFDKLLRLVSGGINRPI
jgi:hypothetical protein